MKNLRLVGGLAALAALLILVLATAAWAGPLPLVASTSYATTLDDGYTCVATADGGAVYAAGYAHRNRSLTRSQLLLVKYVDDGSKLTQAWQVAVGDKTSAVKVAVDNRGNVVVAGNRGRLTDFHGNGSDIVVARYSPDGHKEWTTFWDGPAHGLDYVKGLAVDARDNVIVCGSSFNGRTGRDYVTLKFKTSGKLAWARGFAGPSDFDEAHDVAVDPAGDIYVTGSSRQKAPVPNLSGLPRAVTISYSPSGRVRWMLSDTAARSSWGSTVDYCGVAGAAGVVLSGSRMPRGQHQDHLSFEKLRTSDGRVTWLTTLDQKTRIGVWPEGAALDATGAPVVAGDFNDSGEVSAYLGGVSAAGEAPWSSTFASAVDNPAWAEFAGVAVGADGRVLAAGNTATGEMPWEGDQPRTFLVRYSPVIPVTAPLDYVGAGSATTDDSCSAVAIGDKGMYAVGKTGTVGGHSDAVLLKF
jgi:hypothetical protein